VYVIKPLFMPLANEEHTDVAFARSYYMAVASLVADSKVNCTLKVKSFEELNREIKSTLIVCGQRTLTTDLQSWGVNEPVSNLSVSVSETLGAMPTPESSGQH
jgi:hypothetical protein